MTGKASVPGRGRKPRLKVVQPITGKGFQQDDVSFIIPNAPEWLTPVALDKWLEIAPILAKNKVITDSDLHNLELFCTAYANWRDAQDHIALKGTVIETPFGPKKNPSCTVANECSRQIAAFGALLGLDPTSRARVGAPSSQKQNAFSGLLKQKQHSA